VIQRECFAVVEDRQVVMRVAAQADHVAHRHDGAATGQTPPGRGFELGQGGGDDDGGRQPVVLTQLPGGQQRAQRCQQRVVAALAR